MDRRLSHAPLPSAIANPEGIIRAANAARRTTRDAPLDSTPLVAPKTSPMAEEDEPTPSTPAPSLVGALDGPLSTRDCLRALLQAQQASVVQALADRQAAADRIERLEEAMLLLSTKDNRTPRATSPPTSSGRIDLTRFNTSDGPVYRGPYHEI